MSLVGIFARLPSLTIDRFVKGQPPLASLDDLAECMKVVDAAYAP